MCDSDTTTAANELVDGAQGISLDGGGDHHDATAPIRCLVASNAAIAASGRKPKQEYILNKRCLGSNVVRFILHSPTKNLKRCSQVKHLFDKNSKNDMYLPHLQNDDFVEIVKRCIKQKSRLKLKSGAN